MRWALILMLALAGCENRPRMHSDSDIEAMAQDAAQDVFEPKARAIETRLDEVEQRLGIAGRIDDASGNYASAIHRALDEERENRQREVAAVRDHYNEHLRLYHGAR